MASIQFVRGNLVEAFQNREETSIVHGCNCFHTMGSGFAKQISKAYPRVLEADKRMSVKGDASKLGTFTKYHFKEVNIFPYSIYNLYSQYTYWKDGQLVMWEAVLKGLVKIVSDLSLTEDSKNVTLAMPLIGCGLAGGKKEDLFMTLYEAGKVCRDNGIYVKFRVYELD